MTGISSLLLFEKICTVETIPVEKDVFYFTPLDAVTAIKNTDNSLSLLLDREAPVYDIQGKLMMPDELFIGIIRNGKGYTENDYELMFEHLCMNGVGVEIIPASNITDDYEEGEEITDDYIIFPITNIKQKQNPALSYEQLDIMYNQAIQLEKYEEAGQIAKQIELLYPERKVKK